jgi:Tol biopolymer transport system component
MPANLSDISPDGKLLVFHQAGNAGGTDIMEVETAPNSKPKPLLQTQFQDVAARISPDGRWYLYRNNESGHNEIYVQAMPGYGAPAGKWLVSRDGGIGGARWRQDSREILFLSFDGSMMAADVKTTPTFESGAPHKLFDVPVPFKTYFNGGIPGSLMDMTRDGQRFLFAVPVTSADESFQVVTDWPAALSK